MALLFPLPRILADIATRIGVERVAYAEDADVYTLALIAIAVTIPAVVVSKFGRLGLRSLFLKKKPGFSECLIWSAIGLLLGTNQFVRNLSLGYKFDEPGFFLFTIGGVFLHCVIWPLYEEGLYRGVAFAALYNGGRDRALAYIGSTLLFTLSHSKSYYDLFRYAATGLDNSYILALIIFSVVAAYIYESTGKLMLCVVCHAAANTMQFLGVIAGNLLGSPPID
jgi:membrane protease YdiL (CAAX protease family)